VIDKGQQVLAGVEFESSGFKDYIEESSRWDIRKIPVEKQACQELRQKVIKRRSLESW